VSILVNLSLPIGGTDISTISGLPSIRCFVERHSRSGILPGYSKERFLAYSFWLVTPVPLDN
jgi:hypothetical protein